MTQCVLEKTISGQRGFSPMTAVNLLLKINTKMDGVNCRIDKSSRIEIFSNPIMILVSG
jgi:hypothetical protein